MKRVITKIFAILTIGLMLINSSLLSVISVAIDSVEKVIDKAKINAIYEMQLEKYVNYDVNDIKGVMTQLNLKTGIEYQENEEYKPLNSIEVEINMPKVNGELPEKVEVIAKSTKATNGDEKGKDFEYAYDEQNGKLSIKTQNKADKDGNIYSENVKDARDEMEIYAYYTENAYDDTNTKKDFNISGKIKLNIQNSEELEVEKEINENYEISENISGLISTDVITSDIYDGYIKANKKNNTQYETEYTENMKIQIGYENIADKVQVKTKNLLVDKNETEKETEDIVYTKTIVNKNEILDKLGEEGTLQILNSKGDILADINKDTEADENGNIEINYQNEEKELTIELSNPTKIGDINIKNSKKIKATMVNTESNKIKEIDTILCTKDENEETKEVYNFENSNIVEIKEATTNIELDVNNTEWTNSVQNDVTFTATLVSQNEKNTLFENPTIEIKLPSEVEKVVLGDVSLLYSDELSVKDVSVVDKAGAKTIVIKTVGKQTTYNEITKGINIIIPASVIVKKDVESANSKIEFSVADNKVDVDVQIKSFVDEKQYETQEAVSNTISVNTAENNNTKNDILENIQVDYKAYLGNDEIKDGDTVHNGEYIKYVATLKNNSNDRIDNVTFVGEVPENAVYVEIKNENLTKEESHSKKYDRCKINEKEEIKEYTEIVSLNAKEEKILSFYVKVNKDALENSNIISSAKLRKNESEKKYSEIKNIAQNAQMTIGLTGWETERAINIWSFDITFTNNTQSDIYNVVANFSIGNKFTLSENNTEIPVEVVGQNIKFTVDKIGAGVTIKKVIYLQARTGQEEIDTTEFVVTASNNDTDKYYSNPSIQNIQNPILKITQTSEKEGETLKYGDEIEYVFKIKNESKVINDFTLTFYDFLDNNMDAISAEYDNYYFDINSENVKTYNKTTIIKNLKDKGTSNTEEYDKIEDAKLELYIPNGEEITIKIKATPRMIFTNKQETMNYAVIEYNYNGKFTKTSNYIKNTILPYDYEEPTNPDNPDIPTNPDTPTTPDNPNNPENPSEEKTYSISGCTWKDENKNGIKESNEKLLSGITVKLFDIEKNTIVVINNEKQITQTDKDGKYNFVNIPKGKYIVLFEYDTENYKLTTYQSKDALESNNSDVINKTVNIDGVEKLVAVTDNISIDNNNYVDIDMGLVENGKFNLSLNKSISKIQLNYDGSTREYNYEDIKLAKVEIPAKSVKNATITVEYKIEVKNEGNIDATVDSIVDYKPEGLDFEAKSNSSWKSNDKNNLTNDELKGKVIKPGETKSVNLYLTKKLSDSSIGVITNKAEIGKGSNFENLKDEKSEDDSSEAQLIISIKTGALFYTGIIIIFMIFAILIKLGITKRIITKEKINKILMIIMIFSVANVIIFNGIKVEATDCWDSPDEWPDEDWLTTYDNGRRIMYTYNYRTYDPDGEKVVDQLFCTDGHDMGFDSYELGEDLGGRWEYNYDSEDEDKNESQIGSPEVSGEAKIKENKIGNKAEEIINGSNYYLVGPFSVEFNGSISDFSVTGIFDDNSNENIDNVKICNDKKEEINISDLESNSNFYIKIPVSAKVVKIASIKLSNKTQKTVKTKYSYSWYETWLTGDHYYPDDWGELAGEPLTPQVLKKWKYEEDTKEDPQDSSDSVEIAVNKVICGSIKITKKDADTSNVLAGAKFRVTGPNKYDQTFTTDKEGKITISNLPIGKYTITETQAPTYYRLDLQSNTAQEVTVEPAGTAEKEFTNRQYGNLEIEKRDTSTNDTITVAGFKFNIYKLVNNTKYYLTSYTEGSPSTVTFSPWGNRYTLTTGSDGKTAVLKNLPIDTYYIEEIAVPDSLKDYYNVTQDNGTRKIKLVTNTEQTTKYLFFNQQIYTDVAGYVWEDITQTKADKRNNLYDENKDKLVAGITVRLRNSKDNSIVQTTTTGNNGQYRFKKVEIEQLSNYYIEFEYNGLKYESVDSNLNATNGSKAKENTTSRINFNKSYSTIVEGQNVSGGSTVGYSQDENGNESNMLNYKSGNNKSTLVENTGYTVSSTDAIISPGYNSVGATMTATTRETGMKLDWKAGSHEITNINFGIYERNQPDLAIATDVQKIDMTINGYKHTYNLGQRNEYMPEGLPDNELNNAYNSLMDGFQVAVKNRNGNYKNMTYTRGIDDAYIAYTKANPNNEERLKVYVTYRIGLKNESSVPYVKVKGLENYADSQLDCVASYIGDDTNNTVKWANTGSTSDSKHNIWKSGEVNTYIESGKMVNVYLVYELKTEAIINLANLGNEGFYVLNNTTEITSYSSYDSNKQAYAGIDKDSAPGNIVYGTVSTYEDDTDSAPELGIRRQTPKEISGLVFEDNTTLNANKERLGDGRYDNGNNTIKNVQVKLKKYNTNDNTAITLYTLGNNGEVVRKTADMKTDDNGKYDFVGIIPGEYYLEYTYGNDTGNITTQDYKSTIVTNDKLKQALSNQSEYWYQDGNLSNYSSAVDNWQLRTNINNNLKNITYSVKTNYEAKTDSANNHIMVANTGKMTFAIEETKDQVTNFGYASPSHLYNIKFGVAQRPKQYLELSKEISYVKLTLATGEVVLEGDPRTDTIRYVTYPRNGMVKAEMDEELIQGSTLEIHYTINIANNSETDYNTEAYYKYGQINGAKAVETTINTVIDYVDDKLQSEYTNNATTGEWAKAGNEIKDLLADNVYREIKTRTTTLTNNANYSLKVGEKKDLNTVNVSKLLSSSEDTIYENYAEIIKVSNDVGRFYEGGTPGNFLLTDKNKTHECDDNAKDTRAQLTVVPPTGNNYVIYYVIGIVSLSIIAGGIVFIKKKIL